MSVTSIHPICVFIFKIHTLSIGCKPYSFTLRIIDLIYIVNFIKFTTNCCSFTSTSIISILLKRMPTN